MSRVCQVTGKRPTAGNNVSKANNRTRRRFLPNLHNHRFWLESEQRYVKLRVSASGMRTIDPSSTWMSAGIEYLKPSSTAKLGMSGMTRAIIPRWLGAPLPRRFAPS